MYTAKLGKAQEENCSGGFHYTTCRRRGIALANALNYFGSVMPRELAHPSGLPLEERILTIRSEKVILDTDLAAIYGVTTKRLNEQLRRNREKFPPDFAFQLTPEEFAEIKISVAEAAENKKVTRNWSQIATSSTRRGATYRPWAFTEHGAIMAANILNSPQAVQMSVFVVRAFVKMRAAMSDRRDLAQKLADVEHELKSRLDIHEAAIVDVLQRIMRILDPPADPPEPERPEIGFHIKEESPSYRIRKGPPRKQTRAGH